MTLIAAWIQGNTPVLIGDVMVSRINEFDGQHFPIPTRDDLADQLPADYWRQITGIEQKIYKISDNFVVGWAGSTLIAKAVIKLLVIEFSEKTILLEEIKSFLENLKDYQEQEIKCELIGWVIDKQMPFCFHWVSDKSVMQLGDSFVAGSGADHFLEFLKGVFMAPVGGETNSDLRNIISWTAGLLATEYANYFTLLGLFGGGYQILYLEKDGFRHAPSRTYFLYKTSEKTRGELNEEFILYKAIKFSQDKENLHILSTTFDAPFYKLDTREQIKRPDDKIYIVPPIYKEALVSGNAVDVPVQTIKAEYISFSWMTALVEKGATPQGLENYRVNFTYLVTPETFVEGAIIKIEPINGDEKIWINYEFFKEWLIHNLNKIDRSQLDKAYNDVFNTHVK